jgi:hypothetical protein
MTKKKTNNKKKPRSSVRGAGPPENDEEVLTQEELLKRIRKARTAKAGVEYQPPPPQPKKKGPVKPFIPPFDPNLPPAAFPSLPTMGQPIPTGTREGHLRRAKEDRERRLQGLEPLPRESYHSGPIFRISGQNDAPDVKQPADKEPASQKPSKPKTAKQGQASQDRVNVNTSEVEYEAPRGVNVDWEASNTVFNPVYMRNMATMASDGQKEPANSYGLNLANRPEMDFSDSDLEIITEKKPPVPQWGDLTPSLRAEIMDNLLEHDTWEEAVNKLGLTLKQARRTKEYLNRFHKATEHEDEQLKEMREEQLQTLLNMDYSNDRTVPEDGILGRTSKEHQKNIMKDPNQKLLQCKSGDLRTAWRFLNERGLPQKLAGDWNCGAGTMRPDEDEEPLTKRVKWSYPLTTIEGPSAMPMNVGPVKHLSSGAKTAFLNNFGQAGSIVPPAQEQHPIQDVQKHWDDWEQLFITQPDEDQVHLVRERRLQLALGEEDAATLMAKETGPALPEPAVAQFRFNQRIERAKREAEAEREAAAVKSLPFTARDIAEGTWEQKMEARYAKLANDCQKLLLSYDAHPDIEHEENSELDEVDLDALVEEAMQFNGSYRPLLRAKAYPRSRDADVDME